MTSRIVVPLDMSDVSESAIPLARELATNRQLPVTLLSVVEMPSDFASFLGDESGYEEIVELESGCKHYLLEMTADFPGLTVDTVVVRGRPAEQIVRYVDSLDDPLLVMSSHGHSGFRRLMIGSDLARVIHGATCPVLVARAGDPEGTVRAPRSIERVLVPLDGSEFAEHALTATAHLTEGTDAELRLIRIPEMVAYTGMAEPAGGYQAAEMYAEASRTEAERYLKETADRLESAGRKVSWEVRDGTTTEAIVEAAEASNADLIAMSTHGRTGFKRFVMGSVAERVLKEANLPVLMVGPEDDED